uniref:Uncharacterized protein n=1 Tax=Anopheles dirus TaxID=7168 RepID=A0A182NXJ7_9DIPT
MSSPGGDVLRCFFSWRPDDNCLFTLRILLWLFFFWWNKILSQVYSVRLLTLPSGGAATDGKQDGTAYSVQPAAQLL